MWICTRGELANHSYPGFRAVDFIDKNKDFVRLVIIFTNKKQLLNMIF